MGAIAFLAKAIAPMGRSYNSNRTTTHEANTACR